MSTTPTSTGHPPSPVAGDSEFSSALRALTAAGVSYSEVPACGGRTCCICSAATDPLPHAA